MTAAAAALSLARPLHVGRPGRRHKPGLARSLFVPLSCRSQLLRPDPEEDGGGGREREEKGRRRRRRGLDQLGGMRVLAEAERVGRGLKEMLSPRQKGDWKDVLLMSLSFAVYVYVSQRLVCAYCAWISMLNHARF